MPSISQTYSSLRSDLHHQENNTEIALAELSSLTSSPPSESELHVEDRLLQLFSQRRETMDSMARLVDNDPTSSAARVHQLSRAREILVEHEKEFRRMKSSIQQTRDREALMKSIKGPRTMQPSSDMQMLVSERERIDHSHGIADAALDQAYATRAEFGRQRQTLTGINQRLMQSASTLSPPSLCCLFLCFLF